MKPEILDRLRTELAQAKKENERLTAELEQEKRAREKAEGL